MVILVNKQEIKIKIWSYVLDLMSPFNIVVEATMLDKLETLVSVYVLRAMTTLSCQQIVEIDKVPPISSVMCLSVLIGNQ